MGQPNGNADYGAYDYDQIIKALFENASANSLYTVSANVAEVTAWIKLIGPQLVKLTADLAGENGSWKGPASGTFNRIGTGIGEWVNRLAYELEDPVLHNTINQGGVWLAWAQTAMWKVFNDSTRTLPPVISAGETEPTVTFNETYATEQGRILLAQLAGAYNEQSGSMMPLPTEVDYEKGPTEEIPPPKPPEKTPEQQEMDDLQKKVLEKQLDNLENPPEQEDPPEPPEPPGGEGGVPEPPGGEGGEIPEPPGGEGGGVPEPPGAAGDDALPGGGDALTGDVPAPPGTDLDGDGVPDPPGADLDGDGIPDTAGSDVDGDGIPDPPGARDLDGDGTLDVDGAGIPLPGSNLSPEEALARLNAERTDNADTRLPPVIPPSAIVTNGTGLPGGPGSTFGTSPRGTTGSILDPTGGNTAGGKPFVRGGLPNVPSAPDAPSSRSPRVPVLPTIPDDDVPGGANGRRTGPKIPALDLPEVGPGGGRLPNTSGIRPDGPLLGGSRGDLPGTADRLGTPVSELPNRGGTRGGVPGLASAGVPGQGMMPPMMPPMGGAGGPQQGGDRDRQTWLLEDDDVWRDDDELPPAVLGRGGYDDEET